MTAEKFPERSSSTVSAFILLSSSNFSFVKAWSTINPSRWWSVKLQIIIEWGLRCINGWRRRFIHRHFQIKPATNLHRTIKVFLCARRKRFFMSQIFAVSRSNANIASLRWLFVWTEKKRRKVEYQFHSPRIFSAMFYDDGLFFFVSLSRHVTNQ